MLLPYIPLASDKSTVTFCIVPDAILDAPPLLSDSTTDTIPLASDATVLVVVVVNMPDAPGKPASISAPHCDTSVVHCTISDIFGNRKDTPAV